MFESLSFWKREKKRNEKSSYRWLCMLTMGIIRHGHWPNNKNIRKFRSGAKMLCALIPIIIFFVWDCVCGVRECISTLLSNIKHNKKSIFLILPLPLLCRRVDAMYPTASVYGLDQTTYTSYLLVRNYSPVRIASGKCVCVQFGSWLGLLFLCDLHRTQAHAHTVLLAVSEN